MLIRAAARRATAVVASLSTLGTPVGAGAAVTTAQQPPRVTMITDSVGGALFWAAGERNQLARGLDLRLETKTCRKLAAPGCVAYGDVPPSALETVRLLGSSLGGIVIVEVGYNDLPQDYGRGLDQVMQALTDAGVRRVLWVTLHEAEPAWSQINDEISAAALRWPELTVANWAPRAARHPEWFVDHAHMNELGVEAFVRFLRPLVLAACGSACDPPVPPTVTLLPPTVQGHRALLRWRGDGAARTFEVGIRRVGGAWRSVATPTRARSVLVRGIPGTRMQARVRARDGNGLAGAWSPPRAFRL